MTDVTVYLNRDGLNTVEAEERSVQVSRSLSIVIENHGKPTHVHLHPDDDLATLGTIEDPNWFIPAGEWRDVELTVSEAATGHGRLEIAAGYGQEEEAINVDVTTPDDLEAEAIEETADQGASHSKSGTEYDMGAIGLTGVVNEQRLREPLVIGAGGALVFLFLGLVVVNPLAALGALLGAVLGGSAVFGYIQQPDTGDEERPAKEKR